MHVRAAGGPRLNRGAQCAELLANERDERTVGEPLAQVADAGLVQQCIHRRDLLQQPLLGGHVSTSSPGGAPAR
jgi:hypothetical protein